MMCHYEGCGWQPIAAGNVAATKQYMEHVVEEHAREVDDDIPEGYIKVKRGGGEWEFIPHDDIT